MTITSTIVLVHQYISRVRTCVTFLYMYSVCINQVVFTPYVREPYSGVGSMSESPAVAVVDLGHIYD
jgi:hypothetical protein